MPSKKPAEGNPHLQALQNRAATNTLRTLAIAPPDKIDFFSNDYLGFARSEKLSATAQKYFTRQSGSTGSRLISGNSQFCIDLEKEIAQFHETEAALIFNSGYDANIGLLSCIASRHDTIIYDELSHASVIDGIRLSLAKTVKFKHNDLEDLSQLVSAASGEVYVVAESLYSMDGEYAPLKEMAVLCEKYNAKLIVDEAHTTGLSGNNGAGVVQDFGITNSVFSRVHTFGKAMGAHGAAVVGSQSLINYLVNYSRSFIYTTALPQHSLAFIKAAYQLLPSATENRAALQNNINEYLHLCTDLKNCSKNKSAIQYITADEKKTVDMVAEKLKSSGINAKAIKSPTVPQDKERVRICLHAFNTAHEIKLLADTVKNMTA